METLKFDNMDGEAQDSTSVRQVVLCQHVTDGLACTRNRLDCANEPFASTDFTRQRELDRAIVTNQSL